MDHRRIKLRPDDFPLGGQQELGAFGEPVDVGFQRAQFVAQSFGQHRNDPIHEVGGIATSFRFFIQGGPGFDVMRNIGNVNPQFPVLIWCRLQADGVIKILGVIRVDGHHGMLPAVRPPGEFRRLHLCSDGLRLIQDALRKVHRQPVLP